MKLYRLTRVQAMTRWLVLITVGLILVVVGPFAFGGPNFLDRPYTGDEPDTLLLFHFDEPDELLDSGPSGLDLSGFYGSTYVSSGKFGDAYTNPDSGGYTICNNGSVVFGPEGHTDGRHYRVIEFWLKLFAEQFDANGNFRRYAGQTVDQVNLVRGQGGAGIQMNVGTNTARMWDSWCYPPSAMSPALTWAPNVWYHLAFEHIDSVGVNMYRDGSLVGSSSAYHNARFSNPNGSLVLGDYIGYQRDGLVGQMDEFRISDTPFEPGTSPPIQITESNGNTEVFEEGETSDTIMIELTESPANIVTVTADPNGNGNGENIDLGSGAGVSINLTFTTANWQTPQTITVTAVDDTIVEDDQYCMVDISFASDDPDFDTGLFETITVKVVDNDNQNNFMDGYTGNEPDTLLLWLFDTPDELLDSGPSGLNLRDFYGSTYVTSGKFGDAYTNPDSRGYTIGDGAGMVFGPEGHTDGWDTRVIEFWLKLFPEQFDGSGNFQRYGGQTGSYVNLVRGQGGIGIEFTEDTNLARMGDSWGYPPTAYSSALSWQSDVWYHLAYEHIDSTGINFYRDGILVGSSTAYNNERFWNPNGSLVLGDYIGYQKDGLVGQMDEFRISNTRFRPLLAVRVTESDGYTYVEEEPRHFGSTTDSFTVHLDKPPTDNVIVEIVPSENASDINLGPGSGQSINLTFTNANWNVPQTITVTAVPDSIQEIKEIATVNFNVSSNDFYYNNRSVTPLEVIIIDYQWQMTEFLTSVWNESADVDLANAQAWADADFTAIFCNPTTAALNVCQTAGIKGIAVPDSIVQAALLDDHEALWGYFLSDEPDPADYAWWGEQVKLYHKTDPRHPCMLDPLGYEEDLDNFMALINPEFLPGGIYPWYGGLGTHFEHLEDFRDTAADFGVPLTMWTESTPTESGYPADNEEKIRYSAYTSLAYGVKGIHWFPFQPILDESNNLTPTGQDVAIINAELKRLGPVLVQLDSINVYHTPPQPSPAYTRLVPADHWIQLDTNNLVLGMFQDSQHRDYAFIANRSITGAPSVEIELREHVTAVHKLDKSSGTWIELTITDSEPYQTVNLPLAKGDGELVRIMKTCLTDFDNNYRTNMVDFAHFAIHWMESDCGACGGADFTDDGNVGLDDLFIFVNYWLLDCSLVDP